MKKQRKKIFFNKEILFNKLGQIIFNKSHMYKFVHKYYRLIKK
jgi:hypothetical protein